MIAPRILPKSSLHARQTRSLEKDTTVGLTALLFRQIRLWQESTASKAFSTMSAHNILAQYESIG